MSAFHFPILPVPDILIGLNEMFNISLDEGCFKRPDPGQWQDIFVRVLCEITNCPVDLHIQQPLMVQDFDYPELFTDAVPLMHLVINMKKIMLGIGVPDFGHADIANPTARRLQKICSALINYQRFKLIRLDTFYAIKDGIDQQREHHDTLLKRNEELKQKINNIKAERAQQEPEVIKVQEQIEHMTARMQEHHRSQAGIQKSITEVKTTISEKKAYTDQMKVTILKAKEDADRLSMKIVQSPERVRHEQDNMKSQLESLKDGLERKRHRLTELQTQRGNVLKWAGNAEKGLQLLESVQGSINKENEIDAEIAHNSDRCQDLVQQQRELGARRDQVLHMLTTRQEKAAKLSLQHQSRMKVLQEQAQCLKEQRENCMQKQSSDAQKKSAKLDYKRKKEDEVKQKQRDLEQKSKKIQELYSRLLESVDKYDRQFENQMADVKKCIEK